MLCLKQACLVGFDIIVIFLFCLILNNDGPEKNPGRAEAVVKQLEFLERKTQNLDVKLIALDGKSWQNFVNPENIT